MESFSPGGKKTIRGRTNLLGWLQEHLGWRNSDSGHHGPNFRESAKRLSLQGGGVCPEEKKDCVAWGRY